MCFDSYSHADTVAARHLILLSFDNRQSSQLILGNSLPQQSHIIYAFVGVALASSKKWASGTKVHRVTLATRALPASRALMNEPQIVAYINARWDVEVVTTTFKGTLYDSMDLMQHTDIFLGMHGAGWTNALFLSQVLYPINPPAGGMCPKLVEYILESFCMSWRSGPR